MLPLHTFMMIRVWLPGVSAPIDIDQAMVRWNRGYEFGVEIQSISNGSEFRLAGFIERTLQLLIGCDEALGQVVG